MENLLISACLMGFDCKYSGGNNKLSEEKLAELREKYRLTDSGFVAEPLRGNFG